MATPEQWAAAIMGGGVSITPEAVARAVDAANARCNPQGMAVAHVATNPPKWHPGGTTGNSGS